DSARSTFGRQALPMSWDFTELNPTHDATGSFRNGCVWVAECLQELGGRIAGASGVCNGYATQSDATSLSLSRPTIVSTDPPYYDNIGYADLSDFFYVWLRRSLKPAFPDLFATLAVPKTEELVATPYRHGTKEKAEAFFLNAMTQAMRRLA